MPMPFALLGGRHQFVPGVRFPPLGLLLLGQGVTRPLSLFPSFPAYFFPSISRTMTRVDPSASFFFVYLTFNPASFASLIMSSIRFAIFFSPKIKPTSEGTNRTEVTGPDCGADESNRLSLAIGPVWGPTALYIRNSIWGNPSPVGAKDCSFAVYITSLPV